MPAVEEIKETIISPPGYSLGLPTIENPLEPVHRMIVGDLGFSFPATILFGATIDRRLRVKNPIPITLSKEGDVVVASSSELEEFGYGNDISEALDDFARTLAELYLSLEENADRLGDDLKQQFSRLCTFIEVRSRNEGSRIRSTGN